jgi:hypothetical protein
VEILLDSFIDTVKLVPLLFLIYFIVGLLEYRCGDRMGTFITRFGMLAPAAGALFGCIPQCGFSVVASALYAKRMISPGTLLAVFISTSDEAVPVLLSVPERAGLVAILIAVKVAIAIAAGIGVDLFIRKRSSEVVTCPCCHEVSAHAVVRENPGCCSHGISGERSKAKLLVIHPLRHTAKIFAFIFVLTAAFGFIVHAAGPERLGAIFMRGTVFQPVLAALIGLVPSCFASVLLAGLFIKGIINFGSLVAGLSAGCGLGLLVLIKENEDRRDTLRIIGLLLGFSILAGLILSAINLS